MTADTTQSHPPARLGPGRTVIEASAGTGKTFTIASEVTRFVAVDGVELERILVVTFTRAATAELRTRVRERMADTLRAIRQPDLISDAQRRDELLTAVGGDPETAADRLDEALTRFDRAQIFTIHGFAQRLLGQLGLRSQLPADLDPDVVDDLLLTQVAGDLVVARFADHDPTAPDAGERVRPRDAAALGKAVIETPDAIIVPDAAAVTGRARHRVELAHAMAAEVRRRMRTAGSSSFDDGLMEVRHALDDPAIGEAAHRLLERRYDVALVDEAQDTDPIQWDVIRRVFDQRRLVIIGDPKQSIYSFRGADIEAYLAAVSGADQHDPLDINWRSDGPLITALEQLFTGQEFGDPRIAFQPVTPAEGHEGPRLHGPGAALTIRQVADDLDTPRRRNGGYFIVGPLREKIAADAADGIVRMLGGNHTIDDPSVPGGVRPVGPGDIAVLCRTRRQVDMVRDQLLARGVPSVAARTGSVFATAAAEEWRRFLLAVERPDRPDMVRLAATTLLVGMTPVEVASLDDADVLDLQQQAKTWREMLQTGGVPALLERLGRERDLAGRVLATADGERTMTDLVHIAEELHTVWRRGRTGSLIGWLETTMAEARTRMEKNIDEPESRQRRLETDAAAVEVQTVHGAKGLQYPVVLVPYAWDVFPMTPDIPVFHEAATSAVGTPGGTGGVARRRLVDVAGPDGPDYDLHCAAATAEETAEESRLLYVAMTRAKHRLVVWWVENNEHVASTMLHRLLTGGGRRPETLAAGSDGTIAVTTLRRPPRQDRHTPPAVNATPLARAMFTRSLDHLWRRASFSSLSPAHPFATGVETSEHPGRDDETHPEEPDPTETEGGLEAVVEPQVPAIGLPMADLPRGARFGTLVHEVFEHADFAGGDPETEIRRVLAATPAWTLGDLDIEALVEGIVAAVETPLGPDATDIRLCDLTPESILDEMRFGFPVRTEGPPLTLADLGRVMLDHLPAEDPFRRFATDLVTGPQRPFRGYLTGAIDVTAALPGSDGPRYVVMDYKSNALPALGEVATAHDYGPGPLAEAMIDGNYVLQATLYQVALHRYLQWRLAGYDPHRHLGGSMYLFVRGMAGPDTPVVEGERCGVSRWRPPPEMIVALSEIFTGATP